MVLVATAIYVRWTSSLCGKRWVIPNTNFNKSMNSECHWPNIRVDWNILSWPRFSHEMWLREVNFLKWSFLRSTQSFRQCCSRWIPLIKSHQQQIRRYHMNFPASIARSFSILFFLLKSLQIKELKKFLLLAEFLFSFYYPKIIYIYIYNLKKITK